MQKTECLYFDLFTDRRLKWMDTYHPKRVDNRGRPYYTILVPTSQKRSVIWKARLRGIRFRFYEKRWSRSSNYRDQFLEINHGPYRCRYCNRKLTRESMVIDHIVPVAKVKSSTYARRLLEWNGIMDVNDVRNLAPSCRKCNGRKSDKMGLWCVEGWLGQYTWFWLVRKLFLLFMIAVTCFMIYTFLTEMGVISLWP